MRAVRLQRSFDIVMELFDWVIMQTDVRNTVGMVCQPCRAVGGYSEESYGIQMMGEGMTYQALQHQRVRCTKCVVDLAAVLLAIQCQVKHIVGKGYLGPPTPPGRTLDLPGSLPQGGNRDGVPHIGISREGVESDQPLGPLHSPPRAGHDSGTRGG